MENLMKRLFLTLCVLTSAITFGSHLSAKPIEELLPKCIELSQKLVAQARVWKVSNEAIGEQARPFEFAVILTSTTKTALIEQIIVPMLENTDAHEEVLNQMERIDDEIALRRKLIADMTEEALADEQSFTAMSEFVAQCANNFGGEKYTLQDEVSRLEYELAAALVKIEEQKEVFANLSENNKKAFAAELKRVEKNLNTETKKELFRLRNDVSVSEQKLSALCTWARENDTSDFLSKRVLIDGYYRILCE